MCAQLDLAVLSSQHHPRYVLKQDGRALKVVLVFAVTSVRETDICRGGRLHPDGDQTRAPISSKVASADLMSKSAGPECPYWPRTVPSPRNDCWEI